jgi:hypothetical protein
MVLWLIAASAFLLVLLAHARARRLGRQLEQLSQSYWELRYEYTKLRAQVNRLDPEQPVAGSPPAGDPSVAFVPLAALRPGAKADE